VPSPNIDYNQSTPIGPGPVRGGRFNWKRLIGWLFGGVVLLLLILWFLRTGTMGLSEGAKGAYYGSFTAPVELPFSYTPYQYQGVKYDQVLTASDGQQVFYEYYTDPDWNKDFNIYDPDGKKANTCIAPRVFSFNSATNSFDQYDKVHIINPLMGQARLLPNEKLLVMGFAVPVGYCWKSLPSYEWFFDLDYSGTEWLVMVYDLKTGEREEAKVINPVIEGINRIPNDRAAISPLGLNFNATPPVIVDLPGKGLLISALRYESGEEASRTYIYDYRKNQLSYSKEETGLPTDFADSTTLLLSDGRTLIYDAAAKSLKVFNPKTIKVEQFTQARLVSKQFLNMWQLDKNWALLWAENPNTNLGETYRSNYSTIYLYNLKDNQLYQRPIEDLPLNQYTNQQSVDTTQPAPNLAELESRLKRYQFWPLSAGTMLVASYSYQNLPWSFGVFDLEDITMIPAANADELITDPNDHFISKTFSRKSNTGGETLYAVVGDGDNIAYPVELSDGRIMFISSGAVGDLAQRYIIYDLPAKQTSYQLRHSITNLSGWEKVDYNK